MGILGAAGSFAQSAMGASASNKAAIRQYKHDLAIREGNWNKEQSVYRSRMVDYKNEYDENYSAAGRAYAAEQTRMNEMFDQVAFQKQDMLTQLLQRHGVRLLFSLPLQLLHLLQRCRSLITWV